MKSAFWLAFILLDYVNAFPTTEHAKQVFGEPIPNVSGKTLSAVMVNYKPGEKTPPHYHGSAFIVAHILSGSVRSQLQSGSKNDIFKIICQLPYEYRKRFCYHWSRMSWLKIAIISNGTSLISWEKSSLIKNFQKCHFPRHLVNDEPPKVYKAGESFVEKPGDHHVLSENESKTEPAQFIAIFVANTNDTNLLVFDEKK